MFDGILDAVGDVIGEVAPMAISSFMPDIPGLEFPGGIDPGGFPDWGGGFPSFPSLPFSMPSLDTLAKFSPLASAYGAYRGQESTNTANAQMARAQMDFQQAQAERERGFIGSRQERAMDFSQSQAQVVRDWEERMANTSWQRGVADMSRAGINPMLAFMKGGAPAPTASAPSGVSGGGAGVPSGASAVMQNALGAGIHSGLSAAEVSRAVAETGRIEADTLVKLADVERTRAETVRTTSSGRQLDAAAKVLLEKLAPEIDLLKESARERHASGARQDVEAEQRGLSGPVERELMQARAALARVEARLRTLEVPRGESEAKFWRSGPGEFAPYAQHARGPWSTLLGIVGRGYSAASESLPLGIGDYRYGHP